MQARPASSSSVQTSLRYPGEVCDAYTLTSLRRWVQEHPITSPPATHLAGMAYNGTAGNIVFYGGCCDQSFYTQTWTYDGTNWTQQSPAIHPTATNSMAMEYYPPTGKVVLFGGSSGVPVNETWLWGPASQPQVSTLLGAADTYLRQGTGNTNEGSAPFLRVQDSGNNRILTRFDQTALQAAVGSGTLASAKLRLTITANGNNWGTTGRTMDVHRLTAAWAEGNGFVDGGSPPNRGTGAGATWNCAIDSNIANQNDDCAGATLWFMDGPNPRPWVTLPTATTTITNGQSGMVEVDVTADVAAFLAGSAPNYGWLVKKTNEGQAGRVEFGSRETVNGPKLVLTVNP